MSVEDYKAYKKIIVDSYDERSKQYAQSNWHRLLAEQLVDYAPPKEGNSVLDIGTGTGAAALYCTGLVGATGRVLGIDISKGMIAEAEKTRTERKCGNLVFKVEDGERLEYPDRSFDRIYCASAFFWIADKPKTLSNWQRLLKPGGVLGFHAWPETSYVYGHIARLVLKKYGVTYLGHSPTGSQQICRSLLEKAGYSNIEIIETNEGHFISLEDAKAAWISEDHYPIGQYPHPATSAPPEILEKAKLEYDMEMERLATDEGVWNDTSMYYVYAVK
ncbi:MAG: methyltransferase domain-containing protein [Gammaproteobacteria bacterium]|nr:methyltransferase domain-containing protein [Gammaproteobacteria bacterium]MDH5801590.1 methyltransferase domain-containing protein [Gammaproteobacteria bacterium]